MRFFVAKVNLEEQARLGFAMLRPLQIAFESPKFMLPIRLGTVNADGPQELFVCALTRTGRVATTNYRTVRLQSDLELPVFLKEDGEFPRFYRALFDRAARFGLLSRHRRPGELSRPIRYHAEGSLLEHGILALSSCRAEPV